tara:strand:+ start:165 stop:578 length:414 start_codon:yes stop_codon:yes gene_type:complete
MAVASQLSSFTGVVMFTADWCGPCKAIKPYLESKVATCGVTLMKVDVDDDDNHELMRQYSVEGVPAIFFLVEGETIDKVVGGSRPDVDVGFSKMIPRVRQLFSKKESGNQNRLPVCVDASVSCQPPPTLPTRPSAKR